MVGQNWKDTQTITLDTPRKAKVITIEFPDFANTTNSIFGIDNMWLYVKRPENFEARVKPLLNIGALVKYPMGKGGVILNNLRIQQTEGNPVNSQKKRNIVSTILRNLNATFSGGNAVASGSGFNFTPLDLGAKCNAFLTNDKGWPDVRDLGMLPKGDNVLNGVSYNIRDFKTSPLPSCIMLGGTGAPAGLPNALTAIPVAKKADALFFLHTARQFKNWTAPKTGDQTPPVVFQYVINYANGTTEIAPVRLGWEVDNWVNATPQNGKNSTVAWATAFPNDKSKDQAVAYQYIWANPHPELEITSVDIAYPGTGATYAVPVLLGITTATMGK
jgi:beta-galactosidase